MKGLAIASALVLGAVLLPTGPAQAKGCIKGALVGGTAGHFVGHHGLLGAMAGCAIGHHRAAKRERNYDAGSRSGYGSSSAPAAGSGARGSEFRRALRTRKFPFLPNEFPGCAQPGISPSLTEIKPS